MLTALTTWRRGLPIFEPNHRQVEAPTGNWKTENETKNNETDGVLEKSIIGEEHNRVDSDLFESLLNDEEGLTLDFKKEQYLFAKASDVDKSELLKDIIGPANATRRSETYILIGVEDVPGGRANVAGIPNDAHLSDHALQEFVNSKTNTPIHFHYRAFSFEGKQVGIIKIDRDQARPIYVKKDYGRLRHRDVYIRRGSSTSLDKPASPEEIARMGGSAKREVADITAEFAAVGNDDLLGMTLDLQCEFCEVPDKKDIPRLRIERSSNELHFPMLSPIGMRTQHNSEYFRELAAYEHLTRFFVPIRIAIRNVGEVAARNVRSEITFPFNQPVRIVEDLPEKPQATLVPFMNVPNITANRPEPGELHFHRNEDRTRLAIKWHDLQPGRIVRSDPFAIGARESGTYELYGEIFADNLPAPKKIVLKVNAEVKRTFLTVEEICGRG